MRIASALLLTLVLAGCNRGPQNNEAVRQGIMDHLSKVGLNVKAMDVAVASVQFKGDQADATVSITPKGAPGGGMSMTYHLQQQSGKWLVVGRQDAGVPHGGGAVPPGAMPQGGGAVPPGMTNPHGGGAMPPGMTMPQGGGAVPPGMTNPHGAGMAAPGAAGAPGGMPAPEDLPPAGKKK